MTVLGASRRRAWAAPAAAGVGSAALFAASVWLVPPFGFLLCLLSPLPLAVVAWRGGAGSAIAAAVTGVFVGSWLVGPAGAAVYVSQFAAGGCVLGLATRARRSPQAVVGSYVLVSAAAFCAWVAWMSVQTQTGPLAFLRASLDQSVQQAAQLLIQGSGGDAQATLAVQSWAEQTSRLLAHTFAGFYVALATLTGWVNALLLRQAVRDPEAPRWTTWRAPESWIWLLIGSGLAGLLLHGVVGTLALNLFVAALAAYFLQGIAVIQHLFEARKFPRLLRALMYALLFFQLPVMLLVVGVGAFDLWLDFRSRWTPSPPPPGSPI